MQRTITAATIMYRRNSIKHTLNAQLPEIEKPGLQKKAGL
jgi:hypothetical protein